MVKENIVRKSTREKLNALRTARWWAVRHLCHPINYLCLLY